MSVYGELNMPGHFTSTRKSLVPAGNLTLDHPTYSLVITFTTLPKFSVCYVCSVTHGQSAL
jgi:hypothetical protein